MARWLLATELQLLTAIESYGSQVLLANFELGALAVESILKSDYNLKLHDLAQKHSVSDTRLKHITAAKLYKNQVDRITCGC